MTTNGKLQRKLRMGLVGGGRGAFIGRIHCIAAVLDNRAELVAGALSSDPARAKESAADYDIAADRAYGSYAEMIAAEASRRDDAGIDFISIATPNHTHYDIAKEAIEAGLNVLCDKPMTLNLAQAEELARLVERSGVVFVLTHNYTGYPLVRQAREMVLSGELGEIQAVRVQYLQGQRLARRQEPESRRAAWRADPAKAGAAGCFGDIGTHAFNLARYMTGLLPESIACNLKTFSQGRTLDDYGHAVVRFENGALGTLTASQVSHGRENDLAIAIDGSKGALQWRQEKPDHMLLRVSSKPHQVYFRHPKADFACPTHKAGCRIPPGHPEGYLEAFANIYCDAFDAMARRATGEPFECVNTVYPNVRDGVEGMYFIDQCVASHQQGGAWLPLKHSLARR